MKKLFPISAALLAALVCSSAFAGSKIDTRVDNAIDVYRDFTQIPEQAIPASILKNAHGIAILPSVIKVGFTIGGRFGRGVLLVRRDDGSWSNPAFVSLGGGSVGLQIGAQSTDIILVFRDRRSIDNIFNGKLTLGGDASAAAGPVGRQAYAATDERLGAEIYSYSRNRGLFAGVALDGAWLAMDTKSNDEYYGNGMSPREILSAENMPTPLAAGQLVNLIAATAPRLDAPATSRAAMASPATELQRPDNDVADSEVKTYALEPIDGAAETPPAGIRDETVF
ncbi:MAG: lipid-binding SYLF domain-containing protein [Gammaproteobacteria bacterium]|jgi:lipid-binding SYLF domain-containing protein